MDQPASTDRLRAYGPLVQTSMPGASFVYRLAMLVSLIALLVTANPASGQYRGRYAGGRQTAGRPSAAPGAASAYPEARSSYGWIHWIREQMPLKVYVSHGLAIDGIIDEQLGAPVCNVNNLDHWPDLVGDILSNEEQFQSLPVAQGFTEEHYQAAVQGINMWKPLEKEGLFSYVIVDDPSEADIYVFWNHHFVDKQGMALFAGDIRGYTAKRSFPYKAIIAGGRADFKPVVILLRTTEANGVPMPFAKMRSSAAHEFGHALGIEGHSRNPVDLMSIYYGNGVVSANDAATMRYLYRLTPDLIP